jgi:hypothetical protein
MRGEIHNKPTEDAHRVIDFIDVLFHASRASSQSLASFYGDRLGLEAAEEPDERLAFQVGSARLTFAPAAETAEPFYHFALLVPGNRFDRAYEWLGARTRLLPDPESGDTVFDFDNWDAKASYCLDPAGNIVELIAHHGIDENVSRGPFDPRELVGFSEVGLVVEDKHEVARTLACERELHVWDGEVADPGRLAFIGERARTLILCPAGRGWLPTSRRAEVHPVEVVVQGARAGTSDLRGTPHRIVGR